MLYKRKAKKNASKYSKIHNHKNNRCPFCDVTELTAVVEETPYMRVFENRAPYDTFEGAVVKEHLLVTPVEHRESIAELTAQERAEYLSILAKYEPTHSIYSRSIDSGHRSQSHLHTHLMVLEKHRVRAFLFIQRPYFVTYRAKQPKHL